jgi:outer membrane protein assembly factor BamB
MKRKRAGWVGCVLAVALLMASPVWGAGGDLLWEKQFTFLPDYNNVNVYSMVVSATSLIVCGYATNLNSSGVSIGKNIGYIKAFDVTTGDIKWEHTLALGDNTNAFATMAMNGNIVLVRGSYTTGSLSGTSFVYSLYRRFLRAYNSDTGQLLWEVNKDFESYPYNTGAILTTDIVTTNNRVFWVENPVDTSNKQTGSCMVRAYQVKTVPPEFSLLLEKSQ